MSQNVLARIGRQSAAYALASVLQQRAAHEQDRDLSLKPGLLVQLARNKTWLLGSGVDLTAYGLEAAALAVGAIVVVQPVLVCGLLWALPLATIGKPERVTRREWVPAILLVVVVVVTQLPPVQASQQLGSAPTHAVVPPDVTQDSGRRVTRHFVAPFGLVRQHVAEPGRPHVERAAHRRTAARHSGGSRPCSTRAATTAFAQSRY